MDTQTLKQDRVDFNEFLDKVADRIIERAQARHVPGIARVANVWRLNSAEATMTQDVPSRDLLVTFRGGPDASRSSEYKPDNVDSTADAIIDKLYFLTR